MKATETTMNKAQGKNTVNMNDELKISINSHENVNMSNWEVTHTFDTLNSANNKMNILKQISEYLNNGGNKEDIFIMDKSFNIKTNYLDYFKNGSQLNIKVDRELHRVLYMGNIIPFNFNERLINIQYIFKCFSIYSSEVWNTIKTRLSDEILQKSIEMYRASTDLLGVLEWMFINVKSIVDHVVSNSRTIHPETYQKLMNRLKNNQELNGQKYDKYISDKVKNTHNEFIEAFKTRSRPIVGVYNDKDGYFDILNYEQMYMKGALSKTELRLSSITRNSPVAIIIITAGIMSATMWYLHKRQKDVESDSMPKTNCAIVDKLMENEDDDIRNMGSDTLDTIKEVTNKNKVVVSIEKYKVDSKDTE